jgi:hypothetical protein
MIEFVILQYQAHIYFNFHINFHLFFKKFPYLSNLYNTSEDNGYLYNIMSENKACQDLTDDCLNLSNLHISIHDDLSTAIFVKPYAYTTLVMNKPHYVKGALAMAHSLKSTNTLYPIICMATREIYDKYYICLKSVFDEVIVVPYIKYKTGQLSTYKQHVMYKDWKDISFTKWNCLNLDKYDKVCLLDADLIIKKNIDHLFELKTPAGCFGNNWDSLVKYYDKLTYGDSIDNKKIYKGLENGYVVNGHCVVLEPGKKIFNRFISFMDNDLYIKNKFCRSMSDENALVKFLLTEKKTWTFIGKDYNCIPWKNDTDAFILHFFNKVKAWQMDRTQYPDLKIWYGVWDSLQKKYPQTRTLQYMTQ